MTSEKGRYRLGCDIGGTFTDFFLIDQATGEIAVEKCLTTPADPSKGVLDGVERLAGRRKGFLLDTESILHGTTLVINAIIERKGARTGLLTTRGFRDVLEIGREMRYDIYDIFIEFPKPLVPRYLRQEVTERTYHNGQIIIPLDADDLARVLAELRRHYVESIAVCFLHNYANPFNEKKAKALLAELAPDIPVSISSEVLPEVREYERTTTTVVNAYVKPLTASYTSRLLEGLVNLGFQGQLLIMLSSGGMTSAETATEFPVRIVESGPAAGAIAAAYVGKLAGYEDLLSFDMGGTTAKGCVIRQGKVDKSLTVEVARVHRFKRGSGIPLRIPVIDLVEIGAGGGSIARVKEMGLMRVGPESAGAQPGPACYGLGGQEPTVSDADLVLGYLDAHYFLGGQMRLDDEAARKAILEKVALPLGLTLVKAAWGIHELVTENMAAAIRIHMAEKAVDPSKFTLVAFGGAGPVHAYGLAKRLGIQRILIPPSAGIASAFGLLVSPVSFDLVRTYRSPITDLNLKQVEAMYKEMESEARTFILKADKMAQVTFSRSFDICYLGQNYSVNVPVPSGGLIPSKETIRDQFEKVYLSLYGRVYTDIEAQLMNLRLVAQSAAPLLRLHKLRLERGSQGDVVPKGRRMAYSDRHKGFLEHLVYDRYSLGPGSRLVGPAIIEEHESTTIVGSGGVVTVDDYGTLVITLEEEMR
ncbi:MAG: hydantoinase/oxoprolinase family protein [Candidatus Eisenbacteria bacterium]|nr:hydantoinase/oxoprolinase family protein [Candidatus Eisenbacteria bacterium]